MQRIADSADASCYEANERARTGEIRRSHLPHDPCDGGKRDDRDQRDRNDAFDPFVAEQNELGMFARSCGEQRCGPWAMQQQRCRP